jgi:uncharacterized protein (DUF2147 family)
MNKNVLKEERMRNTLFVLCLLIAGIPAIAAASSANGVWSTEKDDKGAYLEVTIAACESDASLTCGVISKAVTASGEDPDYSNLGKLIIKDMKDHGDGTYSKGTIWDPVKDKVYKSKMEVKGDELDVDGCISVICVGQHWQSVAQ